MTQHPEPPHPQDSLLLQHVEGSLDDDVETALLEHLRDCAQCRLRLDELVAFEGFVAMQRPGDDLIEAAMFATADRVLGAGVRPRRFGRAFGAIGMLLAACLLIVIWSWSGAVRCRVRLELHRPEDPLRSAASVRFHLELEAPAPVFVTVFARTADGVVEELLPADEPGMSLQGKVRLPANALLDWEYPAVRTPIELLVITSVESPSATQRGALLRSWSELAAPTMPPMVIELGAAELLRVPSPAAPK